MVNSFYSETELQQIGFGYLGQDVKISKKASIYGAANISVGDHSRIDDFCILSGKISIGHHVHISAYTALYGGDAGIFFDNYSGISARGNVYAMSDDFNGEFMTNSMVPDELRNVISMPVLIGKFCQIGAGCTLLPGAELEEGAVLGAMSLAKRKLNAWGIYAGIPCEFVKERSKELLRKERQVYGVCK